MSQRIFDARFLVLILTNVIVGIAIITTLLLTRSAPISAEVYLNQAAKLQATGLNIEAAEAYEKYFSLTQKDSATQANIAFSIGTLFEKEGQFEKALRWLYLVEILDPSSKSRQEANSKIVTLLERLKKFSSSKLVLSESTTLGKASDKTESAQNTPVVAKVGNHDITLSDLNEAIDGAPEAIRKTLKDQKSKANFLQNMVAEELLFQKAERLQLQADPKVIKMTENIKRQLIVQKLMEGELKTKMTLDEKDLKNFFEANKTKYKDFDKNREQVATDYKMQKAQSIYQAMVTEALQSQQVQMFPEKVK